VIIDDLHRGCGTVPPFEADPPPVIHADAILPAPVSAELFQTVGPWRSQVFENIGGVKHSQFPACALLDFRW